MTQFSTAVVFLWISQILSLVRCWAFLCEKRTQHLNSPLLRRFVYYRTGTVIFVLVLIHAAQISSFLCVAFYKCPFFKFETDQCSARTLFPFCAMFGIENSSNVQLWHCLPLVSTVRFQAFARLSNIFCCCSVTNFWLMWSNASPGNDQCLAGWRYIFPSVMKGFAEFTWLLPK